MCWERSAARHAVSWADTASPPPGAAGSIGYRAARRACRGRQSAPRRGQAALHTLAALAHDRRHRGIIFVSLPARRGSVATSAVRLALHSRQATERFRRHRALVSGLDSCRRDPRDPWDRRARSTVWLLNRGGHLLALVGIKGWRQHAIFDPCASSDRIRPATGAGHHGVHSGAGRLGQSTRCCRHPA